MTTIVIPIRDVDTSSVIDTFELDDMYLHVYNTHAKPYFKAQEVGTLLGIGNIRDKLLSIKDEWKRVVGSTDATGRIQNMCFINEPALYEIIMTMRLSNDKDSTKYSSIRKFRDWVCEKVLPELRHKGYYSIESKERVLQYNQDLRLRTYEVVSKVFERLGICDDRDRVMFADYGRSLMITDCKESLKECSISKRVFDMYGKQLKRNELITLGSQISKEYKRLHGDKPPKRSQFVDGTIRDVCHYTLDQYEDFIDHIIDKYVKQRDYSVKHYYAKKEAEIADPRSLC